MAEDTPEPPAEAAGTVDFTGRRGELLGLLAKNALLTLLTLGVYRFWGRTWVRRYFWRNTVVEGAPLDYTGRPVELLVGFLFGVAVLAAFGLVLGAAGAGAARFAPVVAPLVQLLGVVVLLALVQLALFRAWRYRLSRTLWAGQRAGQHGSSWTFFGLALGWVAVVLVSLGLAVPWMRAALLKYRIDRMHLGGLHFTFEGRGLDLLRYWALPWGMAAAFVGVQAAALSLAQVSTMSMTAPGGGAMAGAVQMPQMPPWLGLLQLLLVVGFLLALLWYRVRELRYVAGRTFLGDAGFASRMPMLPILIAQALVGAGIIGILVVVGPVVMMFGVLSLNPLGIGLAVVALLLVLALLQVLGVGLVRYEWVRQFWKTLTVQRSDSFHQSPAEAEGTVPTHGEGLADALDVGEI